MELALYLWSFVVVVLLYVAIAVLPPLWRKIQARRYLTRTFPCPEHHWLLGHLHRFPGINEEGLMYHLNNVAKFPRCHLFMIGPTRISLHVSHPDTVKAITKTTEPKQLEIGYNFLLPWIGDGLLLSSGAKWFRNRRLLTPGFHFDVLKPYVHVYNESAAHMLDDMAAQATSGENNSVNITSHINLTSLDIILRCAFSSTKASVQNQSNKQYVQAVNALGRQVVERLLNPLVHSDNIYYVTPDGRSFKKNCELSHDVAKEVIQLRRQELNDAGLKGVQTDTSSKGSNGVTDGDGSTLTPEAIRPITEKGRRYVDFLDILLLAKDEKGSGLTDQEILDEVETFMFEGHDTTASGVNFILYNFARHPQHQAAARAELDKVLGDRDEILHADMNNLPVLTRCIKESLRLHPPVPFVGRELKTDHMIDGKVAPAGTLVDIAIWNLHHNPEVWSDPMTYDPDRFLPENIKEKDSHAFMPFSAGPRNCIGQNFAMNEMKTVVGRFLRRFEFSLDDSKPMKIYPDLILRSLDGIRLFLKERKHARV